VRLQPIVYTTDMDASTAWYGRVLGVEPGYVSEMWTAFTVGDATLGVHRVEELPTDSRVELSLVATEPLETVLSRLEDAGLEVERGIQDEAFGRSILLRDPAGSPVQVNEHHH
jgi:catechol 2,3-dioxygenase-like lactoylglutathione lyase family enzyme